MGLARVLVKEGVVEQAAEITGQVLHHPALTQHTKKKAERLREVGRGLDGALEAGHRLQVVPLAQALERQLARPVNPRDPQDHQLAATRYY